MTSNRNADQAEFWSGPAGLKWITHEEALDASLLGATDELLATAAIRPGERVLEIGAGTGANSMALARATGPTGEVLALDISAPLLARANERRDAAGLAQLTFRHADAQTADLPAGHFDVVASRFGVMFFDDSVAAFRNMGRALRPGGRLAFACWASIDENPWFRLPRDIAVARLGKVAPPPPGAPGPMAFEDIARVTAMMAEAGLADAEGHEVAVDMHHAGGVPAVAALAARVGPASHIMQELGGTEADQKAIETGIAEVFAPFASADGARIPARFNYFTARKP